MLEELKQMLDNKKFVELHEYLKGINSADLSSLFEDLNKEEIIIIYRLLRKDKAAELFTILEPDIQEKLINIFNDKELKEVVDELFIDDTVDLLEEMPSNIVKRILKVIEPENRKLINEFLNYPKDSAGTIMTNEFIDLKEDMTVEDAFKKIKINVKKKMSYTCYVVDKTRKIVGIVTIKDLLLSDRKEVIKNLMKVDMVIAETIEDKEDIAKKFDKYNLIELPVVDKEERLVGIVTVDDAINVMSDEAEEDFEKMAAIIPNEKTYFKTSVFEHTRNRIMWLLVLMLSSIITGNIITKYEEAFASVPVLVALLPMVMGTGGNCGSQASTLVIRGLAIEEIEVKDFFKVIWKEIRVALIVGIGLFIVNWLRVYFFYDKNMQLGITLGLAVTVTVIIAKVLGAVLPILAKKLKMDPALMAAPLISTILDICSVMVYFKIAVTVMQL